MSQPKTSIVLFGASVGGRRGYQHLKDRRNILAFCDNSPQKQGTQLCGKPVMAPAQAVQLKPDEFWISSMYFYEITAQLIQLGVDRKKIFIVDPSVLDGYRAANKPSVSATRVLIWGVSLAAQRAYNYYQSSYNILGFISADQRLTGLTFCQKPIFTPAQIATQSADCVWMPHQDAAQAKAVLTNAGVEDWRLDQLAPEVTDTPAEPLWQPATGFFRRRVVVMGTGPLAQRTQELTQMYEQVICFCSDNPTTLKVGKVSVLPLEQAVASKFTKIYIAEDTYQSTLDRLLQQNISGKDIEIVDPIILH